MKTLNFKTGKNKDAFVQMLSEESIDKIISHDKTMVKFYDSLDIKSLSKKAQVLIMDVVTQDVKSLY